MDVGNCNEIDLSFYIDASFSEKDATLDIVAPTLNYNGKRPTPISANIKTIKSDIQNVIGVAFEKINAIPLDEFHQQICVNKKTNNDQDIKILSVRRYALYNTAAIEQHGNIIVEHENKLTTNTSSIEHEHCRAIHAENANTSHISDECIRAKNEEESLLRTINEAQYLLDNIDVTMSDSRFTNFSKIQTCDCSFEFIMTADPIFSSMKIASDIRLKKNVYTLVDCLKKINSMRGVEWNWKKNKKRTTGVIAQELIKIDPDLIDNSQEFMSVNYNALSGYFIEAFKEQTIIQKTQRDKINILEKKLNTQQKEIDTIKAQMKLLLSKL